ncbi:MAG: glutamate formimidoyltransferase, partial [Bacteroidota bacterium]
MQPLIECVPNFSEGQNPDTLEALAAAIRRVDEVQLLHVDPGASAHRTVFTFAGPPAAVVEAAFQAIRIAADRIDMREHIGTHPRMGATDVCPLIPLQWITLGETAEWARRLGERVGAELNIPVYLYEAAATAPHRRNLARIRAGEYEGFREKISHPDWQPDFGPTTFQPRVGQTVIGARDFLIAYNVNLNTIEASLAHEVACD